MVHYGRSLKSHGVTVPKPPEVNRDPYEHEYKFLVDGNEQEGREAFTLVREEAVGGEAFLRETGFRVREESQKRSRQQFDLYFDDKRLTLYNSNVCFRLREKKEVLRVTFKKRFPATDEGAWHEALYERIEEEVLITEPQKEALLKGEPINVFPYRLIAYIAPQCRSIWPVLRVKNRRQVLLLEDAHHRKVELCLDEVTYESPGKEGTPVARPMFEIELESKGAPRESVGRLARHLEKNLGLIPSRETKYQRGITLLKKKGLFTDMSCSLSSTGGTTE